MSKLSNHKFKNWLPLSFGILVALLMVLGGGYWMKFRNESPETPTSPAPAPLASAEPQASGAPSPLASPLLSSPIPGSTNVADAGKVDLSVDANGMSKATVVMNTSQGVIKFKLYPQDAPNTVNRIVELTQKGFYNGLTFHRVVPGFVVQGGDPTGTGTGGSGQKLKAEFNSRHHVEGTMAMARARDPDSADSQFYIALSPQIQLDKNYTIFGQVIEGMDVVRKLKVGDKIVSVVIQ